MRARGKERGGGGKAKRSVWQLPCDLDSTTVAACTCTSKPVPATCTTPPATVVYH